MSVRIQKQEGGTTYAHAATRAMFEAWCRVDGATVPAYNTLVSLIVKKYGTEGGSTFDAVEYFGDPKARKETGDGPSWNLAHDYYLLPKLRVERVPHNTTINYLADTCSGKDFTYVITFGMSALRWHKFERFFGKNPQGIITASHLALEEWERDDAEYAHHAVVLDVKQTSLNCICLKNSWGPSWGNGGSFFVDKLETLEPTPSSAALHIASVSWSEGDMVPSLRKRYHHCLTASEAIPKLFEKVTVMWDYPIDQGNSQVCIGTLPDGEKVAVKRVAATSRDRLYYIHHPNIVEIYGYQEAPPPQELEADFPRRQPMVDIVMELADGTLEDRIKRGGPLGQQEALAVMRDVTSAVVKLADQGIAHCDIKPQNILLFIRKDSPATVTSKIADFGIARSTIHDGALSGTVGWSDPLLEKLCEKDLDPLYDSYSLGRLAQYLGITLPPTIVTEGPLNQRYSAAQVLRVVKHMQQECYVKALECEDSSRDSNTWNDLGNSMSPDSWVRVDGIEYTKRECFLKAVECDPKNGAAWKNLANSMAPNTNVSVKGIACTQEDCYSHGGTM